MVPLSSASALPTRVPPAGLASVGVAGAVVSAASVLPWPVMVRVSASAERAELP